MADVLMRALTEDQTARVLWVDATEAAAQTAKVHGLTGEAAKLAAELLLSTVLMSAWIKGEERISLQFRGKDPEVSFIGEVDAEGHFRGRFVPEEVKGDGRLNGIMLAIKADNAKEMYRGMTEVDGERIEAALARHLRQSDQVDVMLKLDAREGYARGLLIERIPDPTGDEEELHAQFEALYAPLQGYPGALLADQMSAYILNGRPLLVLERRALTWRCRCSRERVETMLRGLGKAELEDMAEKDNGAEVSCHYCNTAYTFDAAALRALT